MAAASSATLRWTIDPNVEVRVNRAFKGTVVSLYEDGCKVTGHQPDVAAVFDQCVWKGSNGSFQSRFFNSPGTTKVTLVSVNTAAKQLHTWTWARFDHNLQTEKPILTSQGEEDPTITWENLDEALNQAFDLTADDDIIRERDCTAEACGLIRRACSTKLGKVAATALALKAVEKTAYLTGALISGTASATAALLSASYNYILEPAWTASLESFGYSGVAVIGTVAAIQLADTVMPERQINARLEARLGAIAATVRARLPA